MKTPREKYMNDAQYKTLVDYMLGCLYDCHYTPSEMREAAMLASIMYEERTVRVLPFVDFPVNPEMEKALTTLREWTEAVSALPNIITKSKEKTNG